MHALYLVFCVIFLWVASNSSIGELALIPVVEALYSATPHYLQQVLPLRCASQVDTKNPLELRVSLATENSKTIIQRAIASTPFPAIIMRYCHE